MVCSGVCRAPQAPEGPRGAGWAIGVGHVPPGQRQPLGGPSLAPLSPLGPLGVPLLARNRCWECGTRQRRGERVNWGSGGG